MKYFAILLTLSSNYYIKIILYIAQKQFVSIKILYIIHTISFKIYNTMFEL